MSRLHPVGTDDHAEPITLDGECVTAGRGLENGIVLEGPRVSRLHCTFHRLPGGGFKLVDAGSRNGTRVNGEEIAQKVLRPGDRIDIGGHLFTFGTGAVARPIVTRIAAAATFDQEGKRPEAVARPPSPVRVVRGAGVLVSVASIAAFVLVGVVIALILVGGDRTPAPKTEGGTASVPAAENDGSGPADAGMALPPPSPRSERVPTPAEIVEAPPVRGPVDGSVAHGDPDPDAASPSRAADESRPGATAASTPPAPTLSESEVKDRLAVANEHLLAFRFADARTLLDALASAVADDATAEEIENARAATDALRVTHDRLVGRLSSSESPQSKPIRGLGAILGATDRGLVLASGEMPWKDLPAERYEEIVLSTSPGAESLLGLAYHAFAHGRDDAAHRALESALELEPGLRGEGNRLLARELGESVPPDGFVVHEHRFMTPERRDAIVAEGRARELFADVMGNDAAAARAAAAAIATMGDSHAERLTALLHDRLRIAQDAVRKDSSTKRLAPLVEEKLAIDAQREKALAIILNEQRYPFPYDGDGVTKETKALHEKTQKEIDRETAALKKLWDEAESKTVALSNEFRERAGALALACDLFDAANLAPPDLPADVAFAAYLPEGEKKAGARTIFTSRAERADWAHNSKTLAANDSAPGSMTEVERTQLRITNDYRILFGRRALAVDEKLLLAARGHCQEMYRCGYFAHDGATEETRTLSKRLRARGYEGSRMGENIAKARSPLAAHQLWIRSSGHHRNILNAGWSIAGSANAGDLYTQNFGTID